MAAATVPAPAEKPAAREQEEVDDPRWQPAMALPCRLTVDLAVPYFKVADFLTLRPGSVVTTDWAVSRDVPLRINGILIAWGGLEGAGNRMAVRVTDLA